MENENSPARTENEASNALMRFLGLRNKLRAQTKDLDGLGLFGDSFLLKCFMG